MSYIINEKSPHYGKIPNALVELKPHQQAILKKMIDMELEFFQYIYDKKSKRMVEQEMVTKSLQNGEPLSEELQKKISLLQRQELEDIEPFGVLGSTVGSGKTYCIIALCLLEKYRKKNWVDKIFSSNTSMATMIVVPSHLYYQWVDAFEEFAGNHLSIEHFDNYDSIMSLYTERTDVTKAADVYLVSDLFFHNVASSMASLKLSFKRVIFDEIDSIKDSLHTNVGAAYTWFVSASFKNMFKTTPIFKFGELEISTKTLNKNFIGCDDQFVLKSFEIPEYTFKSITCDNPLVDSLTNCLSQDSLIAINSCDPQTALLKEKLEAVAHIPHDGIFIDILKKKWNEELDQIISYSESLIKRKNEMMDKMNKINARDHVKNARNIERIDKEIEETTQNTKRLETKYNTLLQNTEGQNFDQEERPKIVKLTNLLLKHKNDKVLIYSEFPRALLEIAKFLDNNEIKYTDFEGGSNEEMYESVKKFKEDTNVNVFLAHSTLFSCGMNLENVTHIIFLHRVKLEVQKQVIGRGQRPGRTSPLMVYELLHKNEKTLQI